MKIALIAATLAVFAQTAGFAETAALPVRPNIIFLLADDQTHGELGCTGHPLLKTPNLDRLAAGGALFENSFVTSASCMPNRTTLLTGQTERRHTIGWDSGLALSRPSSNAPAPRRACT